MTSEMVLELAGKNIRVEYFYNRGTNPVANQVVVINGDEITFFSYNTKICVLKDGYIVFLDKYDFSRTTKKYFKQFLDRYSKDKCLPKKEFEQFVEDNFENIYDVHNGYLGMIRKF